MINVGKMIAAIRTQRGMSQQQLADKMGLTKQAISNYERGVREPDYVTLEALADVLNVPMGMLMTKDDQETALEEIYAAYQDRAALPSNITLISDLHHQRVPMLGSVAAGQPIYDEEVGVYVDTPADCDAALTVKGGSMEPTYLDGDVVYIKCRPDVPEGAVAVVFLDDEATLKHVYKRPTGLTLISDNMAAYPPIMIEFEDYANVRIFGVPVGFTRMYRQTPKLKIWKDKKNA